MLFIGQRVQLLALPAHQLRDRRAQARHALFFAVRREGHVEGVVARSLGERLELQAQPRRVVRTHVHREGLCHGAEAARLLGPVHPRLEGVRARLVLHVPDEECELPVRVLDHVGPGRVASGEVGPARPAQGRKHRLRHRLDLDAAVAIGGDKVLRPRLLPHGKHRPDDVVRPISREPLQPRLPCLEVEALEIFVGVGLRDVHRLGDARIDIGRDRGDHPLVRGGRELERGDEVRWQGAHVPAAVLVQAPGVVLDREFLQRPVVHALLPRVGPGEGRLDAVRGVVGKGEADSAGGRDREEVRIAHALLADEILDLLRQARGEARAR